MTKKTTISQEKNKKKEESIFFKELFSSDLTEEQAKLISFPSHIYPEQKEVLATHWHPEHIPFNLIEKRLKKLYPNSEKEFIIPTQHNELLTWGEFSGVEVDCFSPEFNQKVQLLLHFSAEKVKSAHTLQVMLAHTRQYRIIQLFDFLSAFTKPNEEYLKQAAKKTGIEKQTIEKSILLAKKLEKIIQDNIDDIPENMLKNKVFRDFIYLHKEDYTKQVFSHLCLFVKTVKEIVKSHLDLEYFYITNEIIEEVRGLGGGIVIPHPEQFWPILLADYDVDGYEVWNPNSHRYTNFLISAVRNQNKNRPEGKEILIFMGDDTHFSAKISPEGIAEKNKDAKSMREIGLQTAWEDINIRKNLLRFGSTKARLIDDYISRIK